MVKISEGHAEHVRSGAQEELIPNPEGSGLSLVNTGTIAQEGPISGAQVIENEHLGLGVELQLAVIAANTTGTIREHKITGGGFPSHHHTLRRNRES